MPACSRRSGTHIHGCVCKRRVYGAPVPHPCACVCECVCVCVGGGSGEGAEREGEREAAPPHPRIPRTAESGDSPGHPGL